MIYNIGGGGSSHSVLCYDMSEVDDPEWRGIKVAGFNFKGSYYHNALAVGDKIVFFGSNYYKKTLVLEKENESEQLIVVRQE